MADHFGGPLVSPPRTFRSLDTPIRTLKRSHTPRTISVPQQPSARSILCLHHQRRHRHPRGWPCPRHLASPPGIHFCRTILRRWTHLAGGHESLWPTLTHRRVPPSTFVRGHRPGPHMHHPMPNIVRWLLAASHPVSHPRDTRLPHSLQVDAARHCRRRRE